VLPPASLLTPYLPSVRELAHVVDLAGGFVLVPVEVKGPDLGRALSTWMSDHDHPAILVEPRDSAAWESLAPSLLNLRPAPGGVVVVNGVAAPPPGIFPGLRLLNQRRDSIVRHLGCPLLWCGPHEFLELTWERAPDFWSIRAVDHRLEETAAPAPEAAAEPKEELRELRDLHGAAKQQGDAANAGRLAVRLADALIADGDIGPARAILEEAIQGGGPALPELLLRRAKIERIRGETVAATLTLAEVIRSPEARLRAEAQVDLGDLLAASGSTERAEHAYRDALSEASTAGYRRGEGRALLRLGAQAARAGRDRAEVLPNIEKAEAIAAEIGDDELRDEARRARAEVAAPLHETAQLESLLAGAEKAAAPAAAVELPKELVEAYRSGNLVIVAGSGVAAAAGLAAGSSDDGVAVPEIARAIATLAPRLRAVLTTSPARLVERAFAGKWPTETVVPTDLPLRRGFILDLRGPIDDVLATGLRGGRAELETLSAFAAASTFLIVGWLPGDEETDFLMGMLLARATHPWFWLVNKEFGRHRWPRPYGLFGFPAIEVASEPEALRALATAGEAGSPTAVRPRREIPPPGGPYDPSFYVHRESEERRVLALLRHPRAPVLLYGPQAAGKSALLGFLLDAMLAEQETTVVHLGLRREEKPLSTLSAALAKVTGADNARIEPTSRQITGFLEDEVLRHAKGRVVLVVESLEVLTHRAEGAELLGLLRYWGNQWNALRLLMTSALAPSAIDDSLPGSRSPFFNDAVAFRVGDLQSEQVAALAALHDLDWPRGAAARVAALVGGHPYLLRTIMYEAVTCGRSVESLLDDRATLARIFSPHLKHLAAEIEAQHLDAAVRELLRGFAEEIEQVGREALSRLEALGVAVPDQFGEYRIRYALYADFLRERFGS
jgi:hypothetical protein